MNEHVEARVHCMPSVAVHFSFLPNLEFTFLGIQDGQSTQGIPEGGDPSISDSGFGLAELLGHPD